MSLWGNNAKLCHVARADWNKLGQIMAYATNCSVHIQMIKQKDDPANGLTPIPAHS